MTEPPSGVNLIALPIKFYQSKKREDTVSLSSLEAILGVLHIRLTS